MATDDKFPCWVRQVQRDLVEGAEGPDPIQAEDAHRWLLIVFVGEDGEWEDEEARLLALALEDFFRRSYQRS